MTHNVQDKISATPGFDFETGCLTRIALAFGPAREGASIGVLMPRPDLDHAIHPSLIGWHWFEDKEGFTRELFPTAEEVLEQIAADISRDRMAAYPVSTGEQLRDAAISRTALPAGEADFQCARLRRLFDLYRQREDDPDVFAH